MAKRDGYKRIDLWIPSELYGFYTELASLNSRSLTGEIIFVLSSYKQEGSGFSTDSVRTQSGYNPDLIRTRSGQDDCNLSVFYPDIIRTQSVRNPDKIRIESGCDEKIVEDFSFRNK